MAGAVTKKRKQTMAGTVTVQTIKELILSTMTDEDRPGPLTLPDEASMTVDWMLIQLPPSEPYNEVYPGILIGDYSIASKPDKLKDIGVTHVVNCCQGNRFFLIPTSREFFRESGITFHGIPALDNAKFKMAPHFQKAVEFIEEALKNEGNKIYVHCQSGVSRSATIVIAFLMCKRNMNVMDAVKKIRDTRKILPNDGFLSELVELNKQFYGVTK